MIGKKRSEKEPSTKSSTLKKPGTSTVKTSPVPIQETLYIANDAHYDQVIERIKNVKKTLWIGTADIKDLYVKDGRGTKPLLEVLSDLVKKGVAIRLIHAKEPGPDFYSDIGINSVIPTFILFRYYLLNQ